MFDQSQESQGNGAKWFTGYSPLLILPERSFASQEEGGQAPAAVKGLRGAGLE